MKTFTKLLMVGLLVGISSMASAQHYHARWTGYTEHYVPRGIYRSLHSYRGYDWVTTERFHRGPRLTYVVTMRKGNKMVELTMNRHGRVIHRQVYHFSPRRFHRYGRHYSRYGHKRDYRRWDGPRHRWGPSDTHRDHPPRDNRNGRPRSSRWN